MVPRYLRPAGRPPAATGPDGEPTTARRAVVRAARVAGADAARVVLIGGRGPAGRILADLGMDAPPEAALRIAAQPGLLVADATGAGEGDLRRLARALPRRRPLDGIGHVASLDEEEDGNGLEPARRLANLLGVRAALHVVIPPGVGRPIFEPCPDPTVPDARSLTRGLAERLAQDWLHGGARPEPGAAVAVPEGKLEARVKAAIEGSRSASLVLSSLAWGGQGLAAAVACTWDRTVPRERFGRKALAGGSALVAGILLAALGGSVQVERAEELKHALSILEPVLPGARADPGALIGEARARRYAQSAAALERAAGASVWNPLAGLHPGGAALRRLASRAVADAVVRPAEEVVRERIVRDLRPGADPREWLGRASRLLAASGGPGSRGPAAVLATAYDSSEAGWRSLLARAAPELPRVTAVPVTAEAAAGFVRTMETWARNRYAKGPLVDHARRAAGLPGWRGTMNALGNLEIILGADDARWLLPGGGDPELEGILARARGVLDEATVKRGRAAASRVGEQVREELAGLRLGGARPLLDLGGTANPVLGPAARRLLRAYEAIAREALLVPRGPDAGTGAGATARRLLAGLKGLDRRVAESGVGPEHDEWLRAEIEKAAFGEAADRIESTALGPLAAPERAAVREVERLARERGALRAADRIGVVHERAEEAATRAALRVIELEDPLAVEFDADTDRRSVLERVVAGIERLDALHRREPGHGDFRWEALGRALRGYRNADPSSVLTRMEERARQYAERGAAGCGAPVHVALAPLSGGYPERSLAAFERRLHGLCREAGARAAVAAEGGLRTFFREHLAWRWPYADDPAAPAAPRSTLSELLQRAEGRDVAVLSPDLRAIVAPWSRNRRGDPVLGLAVEWRTAPERERFAEHLVSNRLVGLETLEDGRPGWRYGDRLVARLRLAKDSPLRFRGGADEASVPIGKGSWVRSLATGAAAAAVVIEAPVIGPRGDDGMLRVSAALRAIRAPRSTGLPDRAGPSMAMARPIRASPTPPARLP